MAFSGTMVRSAEGVPGAQPALHVHPAAPRREQDSSFAGFSSRAPGSELEERARELLDRDLQYFRAQSMTELSERGCTSPQRGPSPCTNFEVSRVGWIKDEDSESLIPRRLRWSQLSRRSDSRIAEEGQEEKEKKEDGSHVYQSKSWGWRPRAPTRVKASCELEGMAFLSVS